MFSPQFLLISFFALSLLFAASEGAKALPLSCVEQDVEAKALRSKVSIPWGSGSILGTQSTDRVLDLDAISKTKLRASDRASWRFAHATMPAIQKFISTGSSSLSNAVEVKLESLSFSLPRAVRAYLVEGSSSLEAVGFSFSSRGNAASVCGGEGAKMLFPSSKSHHGVRSNSSPVKPGDFVDAGIIPAGVPVEFFIARAAASSTATPDVTFSSKSCAKSNTDTLKAYAFAGSAYVVFGRSSVEAGTVFGPGPVVALHVGRENVASLLSKSAPFFRAPVGCPDVADDDDSDSGSEVSTRKNRAVATLRSTNAGSSFSILSWSSEFLCRGFNDNAQPVALRLPSIAPFQSSFRPLGLEIASPVMKRWSDLRSWQFGTCPSGPLVSLVSAVESAGQIGSSSIVIDASTADVELAARDSPLGIPLDPESLSLCKPKTLRVYFISESSPHALGFGYWTGNSGFSTGSVSLLFPDASRGSRRGPNSPVQPGDFVDFDVVTCSPIRFFAARGSISLDRTAVYSSLASENIDHSTTDETQRTTQRFRVWAQWDSSYVIVGFGGGEHCESDRDFKDLVIAVELGDDNVRSLICKQYPQSKQCLTPPLCPCSSPEVNTLPIPVVSPTPVSGARLVTGTARYSDYAAITVAVNSDQVASSIVNPDGTWSVYLPSPLNEDQQVYAILSVGARLSSPSATVTVTVSTQADSHSSDLAGPVPTVYPGLAFGTTVSGFVGAVSAGGSTSSTVIVVFSSGVFSALTVARADGTWEAQLQRPLDSGAVLTALALNGVDPSKSDFFRLSSSTGNDVSISKTTAESTVVHGVSTRPSGSIVILQKNGAISGAAAVGDHSDWTVTGITPALVQGDVLTAYVVDVVARTVSLVSSPITVVAKGILGDAKSASAAAAADVASAAGLGKSVETTQGPRPTAAAAEATPLSEDEEDSSIQIVSAVPGTTSITGSSRGLPSGTDVIVKINGKNQASTKIGAAGSWTAVSTVPLKDNDIAVATASVSGILLPLAKSDPLKLDSTKMKPVAPGSNIISTDGPSAVVPPDVNHPITAGATSISGVSSDATGTTIQVIVDGDTVGTCVVGSDGTWRLDGIAALKAGNTVWAISVGGDDSAGSSVPVVVSKAPTILPGSAQEAADSLSSKAPTIDPVFAGDSTLSGTSEEDDGSVIFIYVDGEYSGGCSIDKGAWSLQLKEELHLGAVIGGVVTNMPAGKTASATTTIVVAASATSADGSAVASPALGSITSAPIVDQPFAGASVVTGTSKAPGGSIVNVMFDGSYSGSGLVSSDGSWKYTLSTGSTLYKGVIVTAIVTVDGQDTSEPSSPIAVASSLSESDGQCGGGTQCCDCPCSASGGNSVGTRSLHVPAASKISVFGIPKSVSAGVPLTVSLVTFDPLTGLEAATLDARQLSVSLHHPARDAVQLELHSSKTSFSTRSSHSSGRTDVEASALAASFSATEAGDYSVWVLSRGSHIEGSPFALSVKPSEATSLVLLGPTPRSCVAGSPTSMRAVASDAFGNHVPSAAFTAVMSSARLNPSRVQAKLEASVLRDTDFSAITLNFICPATAADSLEIDLTASTDESELKSIWTIRSVPQEGSVSPSFSKVALRSSPILSATAGSADSAKLWFEAFVADDNGVVLSAPSSSLLAWSATLKSPSGDTPIKLEPSKSGDRFIRVSIPAITTAGTHQVVLVAGGAPVISESVQITAGEVDASRCDVQGADLASDRLSFVAGEELVLTVNLRDAFGNAVSLKPDDLQAFLLPAGIKEIHSVVRDELTIKSMDFTAECAETGICKLTILPKIATVDIETSSEPLLPSLMIAVGSEPILAHPPSISIRSARPSASHSFFLGGGASVMRQASTGSPLRLSLHLRDAFGNLAATEPVGVSSLLRATVSGSSDGGSASIVPTGASEVAIIFQADVPGEYTVSVSVVNSGEEEAGESLISAIPIGVSTAPVLLSAQLWDSLGGVTLVFSHPTDRAGRVGQFPCEDVLAAPAPASFGRASSCAWANDSSLLVSLGSDSSIVPALTMFRIAEESIRALGAASSWLSVSGEVPLSPPSGTPSRVFAVLISPATVGPCDELILDGSASSGGAGRTLRMEWRLTAAVGADNRADLASFLENAALSTAHLPVPKRLLKTGAIYTFKLIATNWFGSSDVAESTVSVADRSFPVVRLPNAVLTRLDASSDVVIRAHVAPPSRCDQDLYAMEGDDQTELAMEWTQVSGPPLRLSREARTSRSLSIPSYLLRSVGKVSQFSFVLSVASRAKSSLVTRAQTRLLILDQSVVELTSVSARIEGGESRSHSLGSPLLLDASASVVSPSLRQGSVTYSWLCVHMDGGACFSTAFSDVLSITRSPRITIPGAALRAGPIRVRLTVSVKSDRGQTVSGRTEASVEILPDAVPLITADVVRSDVDRITVEGSADPTPCTSANGQASTASVLTWSLVSGDTQLPTIDHNRPGILTFDTQKITPGQRVVVEASSTCSPSGKSKGFSIVSFTVPLRPAAGKLSVTPTTASALSTVVTLHAEGWASSCLAEAPLAYDFWFELESGEEIPIGVSADGVIEAILPDVAGSVHAVVYVTSPKGGRSRSRTPMKVLPSSFTILADLDKVSYAGDAARLVTAAVSVLSPASALSSGATSASIRAKVLSLLQTAASTVDIDATVLVGVSSTLSALCSSTSTGCVGDPKEAESVVEILEAVLRRSRELRSIDSRTASAIVFVLQSPPLASFSSLLPRIQAAYVSLSHCLLHSAAPGELVSVSASQSSSSPALVASRERLQKDGENSVAQGNVQITGRAGQIVDTMFCKLTWSSRLVSASIPILESEDGMALDASPAIAAEDDDAGLRCRQWSQSLSKLTPWGCRETVLGACECTEELLRKDEADAAAAAAFAAKEKHAQLVSNIVFRKAHQKVDLHQHHQHRKEEHHELRRRGSSDEKLADDEHTSLHASASSAFEESHGAHHDEEDIAQPAPAFDVSSLWWSLSVVLTLTAAGGLAAQYARARDVADVDMETASAPWDGPLRWAQAQHPLLSLFLTLPRGGSAVSRVQRVLQLLTHAFVALASSTLLVSLDHHLHRPTLASVPIMALQISALLVAVHPTISALWKALPSKDARVSQPAMITRHTESTQSELLDCVLPPSVASTNIPFLRESSTKKGAASPAAKLRRAVELLVLLIGAACASVFCAHASSLSATSHTPILLSSLVAVFCDLALTQPILLLAYSFYRHRSQPSNQNTVQ